MDAVTHTPSWSLCKPIRVSDGRGRFPWSVARAALACALGLVAWRATADETWHLDNLNRIGGQAITVIGRPQVVDAPGGKAIRFDGEHDGLFVPSIPIAGAKAFTIEVLFSPDLDGPPAQRFFHVQDTDGRRALIEIRTNRQGQWWLDAFLRTDLSANDKGLTLIDPHHVHPGGRWYWVAMRYDGKQMADFVDGVKEREGEKDFTTLGDGKISIGVRQNLVFWFKGAVREVRFHREAIPDAQLQRPN